MERNYHELIPGKIFMGGADDVQQMVDEEGVEVVVDLRGEAERCAASGKRLEWIKVPLGDDADEPQEKLLQSAIQSVVEGCRAGKKVAFHCGGGKGRTGTVAYGTLLELQLANSIDEAENIAKSIRPALNIKPAQREALEALYK